MKDFDIRVNFKKTKSSDGRDEVQISLNGLKYDGLLLEEEGCVHIFIPEINKTFVMGDTK